MFASYAASCMTSFLLTSVASWLRYGAIASVAAFGTELSHTWWESVAKSVTTRPVSVGRF